MIALPEVLAIPWHDVEPTKERQCPGVKRWARDLSRPLLLAACRPHIPALQLPQDLTQVIIESRAGNVQPQEFRDRYEDAVVELIRAKQARIPAKVKGSPRQRGCASQEHRGRAAKRKVAAPAPATAMHKRRKAK